MSSIVLSAAVRQNLLSLQNTAQMLSETQNILSTGNKVNSALDNPTSFFMAQGLNNRATDLTNLLDGVSNGVQTLQTANAGITSIQSYIAQAKSIAQQAQQAPSAYSQKSTITSNAILNNGTAITSNNLLGTGTLVNQPLVGSAPLAGGTPNSVKEVSAPIDLATATATGNVSLQAEPQNAGVGTLTGVTVNQTTPATTAPGTISSANFIGATAIDLGGGATPTATTTTFNGITQSAGAATGATVLSDLGIGTSGTITVGGVAVTFTSGNTVPAPMPATNLLTIGNGCTLTQLATALASAATTGSTATVTGNTLKMTTVAASSYSDSSNTGYLADLGFTPTTSTSVTGAALYDAANAGVAAATTLISTPAAAAADQATPTIANPLTAGDTLVVNGTTLTFGSSNPSIVGPADTVPVGGGSLGTGATLTDLKNAVNNILAATTGGTVAISGNSLQFVTPTTKDITLQGSALAKLGLSTNTAAAAQIVISPKANTAPATAITTTTPVNWSTRSAATDVLSALGVAGGNGGLITSNDTLVVNGTTITFGASTAAGATPSGTPPTLAVGQGAGNSSTLADLVTAINTAAGGGSPVTLTSYASGALTIQSTIPLTLSGTVLSKLGLAANSTANAVPTAIPQVSADASISIPTITTQAVTGVVTANSLLQNLSSPITGTASDTLYFNGTTAQSASPLSISFVPSSSTVNVTASGGTIGTGATVGQLLSAINTITGGTASVNSNGTITVNTKQGSTLLVTGGALNKLGLSSQSGANATVSLAPSAISDVGPGVNALGAPTSTNQLTYLPGSQQGNVITAATNDTTLLSTVNAGFSTAAPLVITSGTVTSTISFGNTGSSSTSLTPGGTSYFNATTATLSQLLGAIAVDTGGEATIAVTPAAGAGSITLTSNPSQQTTIVNGTVLGYLGFPSGVNFSQTAYASGSPALTTTLLNSVSGIANGNTLSLTDVNGNTQTISFSASSGSNTVTATGGTLNMSTATLGNLLTAINTVTGGVASLNAAGQLQINTNPNAATVPTGIGLAYSSNSQALLNGLGLANTTGANNTYTGSIAVTQSPSSPIQSSNLSTTLLSELAVGGNAQTHALNTGIGAGDGLIVNGTTITFGQQQSSNLVQTTGSNTISLSNQASLQDLFNAVGIALGGTLNTSTNTVSATNGSSVSLNANGQLQITGGAGQSLSIANLSNSGTSNTASKLGLSTGIIAAGPTSTAASTTTPLVNLGAVGASGNLVVDGTTITFGTANQSTTLSQSSAGISLSNTATMQDLINAIGVATGGNLVNGTVTGGAKVSLGNNGTLTVTSPNGEGLQFGGTNAAALGLTNIAAAASSPSAGVVNSNTYLTNLLNPISVGSTLSVTDQSGTVHSFSFAANSLGGFTSSGNNYVINGAATVGDLLNAIQAAGGPGTSAQLNPSTGAIQISTTNTTSATPITLSGTATYALGLSSDKTGATAVTAGPVGGTLSFGAIGDGTAVTVTFGTNTAAGQVSTLNQLNTALAVDNLQATLDAAGHLSISTTDSYASYSIGNVGGSAASLVGGGFTGQTVSGPVVDTNAISTRANLVNEYNSILAQIDTTAADANYNGLNLLTGDTMTLTFDETGNSQIKIQGFQDTSLGLGLNPLNSSSTGLNDFSDNSKLNAIIKNLTNVNTTLTNQASALSSHLTVIQSHQDFDKALISALQTGAANLT